MSEVRFNWNVFPSTRLEESQIVTPIGCLYTPINKKVKKNFRSSQPTRCESCTAVINPFILFDRKNNQWKCPFCSKLTAFSLPVNLNDPKWASIFDTNIDTIEYRLPPDIGVPPEGPNVYFFVIDTYEHLDLSNGKEKSLESLKFAIASAIDLVPNGASVGLITFDSKVTVHLLDRGTTKTLNAELIFKDSELHGGQIAKPRDYFTTDIFVTISKLLGLVKTDGRGEPKVLPAVAVMSSAYKKTFKDYVFALEPTYTENYRPPRCTGLALFLTTAILSGIDFKGMIGTVYSFLSGPCTVDAGMVLNIEDQAEHMRSHNDIANFNAPHFTDALKFYQALAQVASGLFPDAAGDIAFNVSSKATEFPVRLDTPRWSFELFFGSLDQAGIYEMKLLATETNGTIYLLDTFSQRRTTEVIHRSVGAYRKYNGTLTVLTSGDTKVIKLVGNGHSLPSSFQSDKLAWAHHQKIADTRGVFDSATKKRNFTNRWAVNSIKEFDTFGIFIEPPTVASSSLLNSQGVTEVFIQFQFHYWDLKRKTWKLRVTTVRKPTTLASLIPHQVKSSNGEYKLLSDTSKVVQMKEWLDSFDQYAWMVLFTRLLLDKIDTSLGFENFAGIKDDIHDSVVKLLHDIGSVMSNASDSMTGPYAFLQNQQLLNHNFDLIPQLVFSLSRNPQLINIFNSSPDETAVHFLTFLKSNCKLSIAMIDPLLYFNLGLGYEPVPLKVETLSLYGNGYYILDCGFNIVVYHNVNQDEKPPAPTRLLREMDLKRDKSKENTFDAALLFMQSEEFMHGRSIKPSMIVTKTDDPQARYFTSRLSPTFKRYDKSSTTDAGKQTRLESFFSMFSLTESRDVIKRYENVLSDDISFENYCQNLFNDIKVYSG